MPRLIWTPEALQDLARLHASLAEKSADAASRAIGAIRGSMEPEFREWLAEFGAGGYAVAYRFDGADDAVILTVRHMREAGC